MNKEQENLIQINTQGGTVITGGEFSNVEFVAQKHVYRNIVETSAEMTEVVQCDESDTPAYQSEEKRNRKGGNRVKHLFMDADEEKNEELTRRMADLFVGYLKKHHAASGMKMEARNDNRVSKVFIAFYACWRKDALVDSTLNGRACYRFLTEDCGLRCDTTEKNYADWIKKRIEVTKPERATADSVTEYITGGGVTS